MSDRYHIATVGKQTCSWIVFALVLGGCASPEHDLMPLKVGRESTYEVTAGFEKAVDPVKVTREVPVGGVSGYELSGSFGTSRIAWIGNELVATQMVNAFFDPPIPLLTEDGKDRHWTGRIESMGRRSQATATLHQRNEEIEIGTKKYQTVASVLTIDLPRGKIEVSSWFQSKLGLVQQEQRTNGNFVLRMEILRGPNP